MRWMTLVEMLWWRNLGLDELFILIWRIIGNALAEIALVPARSMFTRRTKTVARRSLNWWLC